VRWAARTRAYCRFPRIPFRPITPFTLDRSHGNAFCLAVTPCCARRRGRMAVKAGVPIVPISISGAYETYPSSAALPLLPNSENLKVVIHPPIAVDGKSEEELSELTRTAISSAL